MAQWKLSTLEKKSAETRTFLTKGDVKICVSEVFRWGSVFIETDDETEPDIDLVNSEGLDVYNANDFDCELESLDDGCALSIDIVSGTLTEEEQEALYEAYDEEDISGLEAAGWSDSYSGECWFFGELELTKVADDRDDE